MASASSSGASSRPSKYTRRKPSNFIVWPVARSMYAGPSSGAAAPMSTETWSKRASAICEATARCQISRYRRRLVRGRAPIAISSGRRAAPVGPDGLVRLLRPALLLLVPARLGQRVLLTVQLLYRFGELGQGLFGDVHRVGSHVRDQADLALAGDGHALVQALGDLHRLARREPELARGLLLQRGRGERRGRRPLDLLLADLQDAVGGLRGGGRRAPRASSCVDSTRPFLSGDAASFSSPTWMSRARKARIAPRCGDSRASTLQYSSGDERLDLALAVDDQAKRHGLHAAGRQGPALQALLQQGREFVADQPVEDRAGPAARSPGRSRSVAAVGTPPARRRA